MFSAGLNEHVFQPIEEEQEVQQEVEQEVE